MHTGSTKKLAYVSPQRLKTATRVAGITREALYKALRPGAKPRFDTIAKVTRALGCKLVVARSIGPPWSHGQSKLAPISRKAFCLLFHW